MVKTKFGYEIQSKEKVDCLNDGASVCFGGCRDKDDVPDMACKTCILIDDCIKLNKDLEE